MRNPILFITLLLVFSVSTFGQTDVLRKKHFNLSKGIAISGYDPVAYFTVGKAVEGSSKISAEYQGITYYFSSAAYKELFSKNPSSYEPQYGGWCAYAMGTSGEKVEVDPSTFKIVNGKLYLFYNKYFNNTLKSWNKDENNLRSKADRNWKIIFK